MDSSDAIFRPPIESRSLYASLDNDNDNDIYPSALAAPPVAAVTIELEEDDPFDVTPASAAAAAPPPSNSPHRPSTSDHPPSPTAPSRSSARSTDLRDRLADSKSPFHGEPLDSVHLAASSAAVTTFASPSSLLPAAAAARSGSAAPQSRRTLSPPASVPRASSSTFYGRRQLGSGSSASGMIGNRSLMGLLGGTTYEPRGFDSSMRYEETVDESQQQQLTRDGNGRADRRRLLSSEIASLPPPPSALSPDNSSAGDDDEEDDDHERSRAFRSHPTFSRRTASDSSRWGGIRLGRSAAEEQEDLDRIDEEEGGGAASASRSKRRRAGGATAKRTIGMGARDRALWRWVNVDDLDGFLQECYLYYVGRGIWAIGLSRLLNLLTVGWVIFFSTFLMGCIDYSVLWDSHHLSEIVVDRCISRFSGLTLLLFSSFISFYTWRVIRFGLGVRKLWEMHEFYVELLDVPENDIQTIPWHAIVTRVSALRSSHPSALSSLRSVPSASSSSGSPAIRLDAHDVANRIMREENYLIALFNKDVVDLSIPLPKALAERGWSIGGRRGMLTRTLEWNLSFCLIGYLFGRDGQVRKAFVSERNKKELVDGLKRRFVLMGLINAIFAPFIVLYLLMYSFFRYFEEYHKNPSSIGSRHFTPLARWQFREFNELPHLFQQRLNRAHPISSHYIDQFPKEKTALVSNFVAFLAGSFAAVLILFSLIDPDAFLHFEITPGRTVLFYIGVFGTVLAVARGMVPDENKVVDPEELMKRIVEETHYLPIEWRGKLHSAQVHAAFGQLFQMKTSLFAQEVLSVLITPFVLWYTLPKSASAIIDFFREFTVHVDGLGYVCSFAIFDFKRHGDVRFGAPVEIDDDRRRSNEGKMEKSFLNFTAHNPSWQPRDQTQSLFLSKMIDSPQLPLLPHAHSSSTTVPPHSSSQMHQLHPRFTSSLSSTVRSPSRPTRTAGLATPFMGDPLEEEEGADLVDPLPLHLHQQQQQYQHHLHPSSISHKQQVQSSLHRDRARMDDRAYQQSILLLNSSTATAAHSHLRPSSLPSQQPIDIRSRLRRSSGGAASEVEEEEIDELSALDGDSFVAPTRERPFGADMRASGGRMMDDDQGENAVVEGHRAKGVMGVLGEMMYLDSGKWT